MDRGRPRAGGLKQALYTRDGTATEAHIASARILTKLGRLTDALGEYRIALGDQALNVALWMELGSVSESAGRAETAREAYAMATRLSPNNPDAARGLQRLADQRRAAQRATADAIHRGGSQQPMYIVWYAFLVSAICLEGLGGSTFRLSRHWSSTS